ncbi:MAG: hypothetical protein KBS97_01310 [Firmicutes bacterium]|nr:hypothetical protein [Candidatus Fiminaster equi]
MKKISTKEFIWYAACGLVIVLGFICMIFGIIGYHLPKPNFVTDFEGKIPLGLRYWGIIFMAIGVIVAVIALVVNAKKADREVEKKIRREQRIAAQNNMNIEVKSAVQIIEEQPAPEEAPGQAPESK